MCDFPKWLTDPRDPNAPLDLAHDLRTCNLRRVLCQKVGLDPATVTDEQMRDLLIEFQQDKELLAVVEADTIEAAGLHDINANRALEVLAVEATQSGLHAYHPMRYPSVSAMLRDKLSDLDPERQVSEWYNLQWLANVFVPWMEQHGRSGLEALWTPGAKSKTRMMVDLLKSEMDAAGVAGEADAPKEVPPELEAKIKQLMLDVADASVTVQKFKQEHVVQEHQAPMEALEAYDYKLRRGGYLVLQYFDEPQRIHVERAVKAVWHLGTGEEAFLPLLTTRKRTVRPAPKPSEKASKRKINRPLD